MGRDMSWKEFRKAAEKEDFEFVMPGLLRDKTNPGTHYGFVIDRKKDKVYFRATLAKAIQLRNKEQKKKEKAMLTSQLLVCPCGWEGTNDELQYAGCITSADEWWECPNCGGESAKMARRQKQTTSVITNEEVKL